MTIVEILAEWNNLCIKQKYEKKQQNTRTSTACKCLINFWSSLDLPLINCEIELYLSRKKICVLIEANGNIIGADFKNTSTKIFVPGVTLATISSNKYRSKTTTQSRNNDLNHMTELTFRNTNRLFVQLFKADENDLTINYFLKYYLLLAEIEDCSLLIKKQFFDKP